MPLHPCSNRRSRFFPTWHQLCLWLQLPVAHAYAYSYAHIEAYVYAYFEIRLSLRLSLMIITLKRDADAKKPELGPGKIVMPDIDAGFLSKA